MSATNVEHITGLPHCTAPVDAAVAQIERTTGLVLGREDFDAAHRADPEVHAEFLAEKRGFRIRWDAWVRAGGHPESRPDELADAVLMARAKATVAARRALAITPTELMRVQLRDMHRFADQAAQLAVAAEAALNRGISSERERAFIALRMTEAVAALTSGRTCALKVADIAEGKS